MYTLTIRFRFGNKSVYSYQNYLELLADITKLLHEDQQVIYKDSKNLWTYEIRYIKERR